MFRTPKEWDAELLSQCASKVLNVKTLSWIPNKSKTRIELFLTEVEATQLRLLYKVYREQWYEEVEVLFKAFIHKHNLFSNQPAKSRPADHQPMSREEIDRILKMMDGVEKIADPLGTKQLEG